LCDGDGSLKFKSELQNISSWKVILLVLSDKVGYIPILRIKYIGEAMHFVVENLLSGRNRFPNIVYLKRKTSSSSLPTPPSPTNSRPRLDRCRLAYTMFCFILGTNGGFR